MYICNHCGETFSEYDTFTNYLPYGSGEIEEQRAECPYCQFNDFVEAKKCKRCGEYVAETQLGLCDCCYGDVYGKQEDESV
jgi:DNA-directed RNA polymerase subunit RPC12/RpoP